MTFFLWSVGWCFAEVVALTEAIRRCQWSLGFYLPGCLWGPGRSVELVLLPLGWAGDILCVSQPGSTLAHLWGPESEVSGLSGEGRGKIHLKRAVNKWLLVVLGTPGWAAAGPWSQGVWHFAQRFFEVKHLEWKQARTTKFLEGLAVRITVRGCLSCGVWNVQKVSWPFKMAVTFPNKKKVAQFWKRKWFSLSCPRASDTPWKPVSFHF